MPEWGLFRQRQRDHLAEMRRNMEKELLPTPGREMYEKKRKEKTLDDSNEHLILFRTQPLVASGYMYVRTTRFGRCKRYFAELRGSTITIFKSPSHAQPGQHDIDGVIATLPVHQYRIEVTTHVDGYPRAYINPKRSADSPVMYVKITDGSSGLDAWCSYVGVITVSPLPNLNDLRIESVIGRGGGGKVFLTVWEKDSKSYALKVIDKTQTFRSARAFRNVRSERFLMEKVGNHPFLLRMQFAFQSETNLYIGTPFCPGGDLASYIRNRGMHRIPYDGGDYVGHTGKRYARLTEHQTRKIACEVLLGLEHLHRRGIVYRDLKPENVFIDEHGYLKIGDYGLAKHLPESISGVGRIRTASICGTRNYLPPEMLHGKLYSFESDLWSLGVMLYRMMVGAFPFDATRTKEVFTKIKMGRPHIPKWLSIEARQLLYGLLIKDPRKRLTTSKIKQLPFFKEVNWDDVFHKKCGPSIPDVYAGSKPVDALENFELSKLYGITIGEMIGPIGDEPLASVPCHKRDPKTMMIGFEYVDLSKRSDAKPAVVQQRSGGLLKRLTSMDMQFEKLSPRNLMKTLSDHM